MFVAPAGIPDREHRNEGRALCMLTLQGEPVTARIYRALGVGKPEADRREDAYWLLLAVTHYATTTVFADRLGDPNIFPVLEPEPPAGGPKWGRQAAAVHRWRAQCTALRLLSAEARGDNTLTEALAGAVLADPVSPLERCYQVIIAVLHELDGRQG